MHHGKRWITLKHVLEETKTNSQHHDNMADSANRALPEQGEAGVKGRLDYMYLPATRTETASGSQAHRNKRLDRDIEV